MAKVSAAHTTRLLSKLLQEYTRRTRNSADGFVTSFTGLAHMHCSLVEKLALFSPITASPLPVLEGRGSSIIRRGRGNSC